MDPAVFTLGIDFGTNSVRALVVRTSDGAELGTAVADYPGGHQGVLLDPADHNLARQRPADNLWGLERAVTGALAHLDAQRVTLALDTERAGRVHVHFPRLGYRLQQA